MRFFQNFRPHRFHGYEADACGEDGHRGRDRGTHRGGPDGGERRGFGPHGHGEHRGFGEHRGRHGLFRRPGGRDRFFEQGDLRYVILKLLSEKPSHGYELIKEIEDRLAGAYAPSPGVVYPTLTLLEELGFIKVQETDGPRKLFAITPEGEAALEQNRAVVEAIFARMAEVNARRGAHQSPQLVRAWENLKTALNLRVGRGPLTPEQIEAIAAVLDDAARAIESR